MLRARSSVVSPINHNPATLRGQHLPQLLDPKGASRARYSTTITVADGSDNTRTNFGRLPFSPDPAPALPCGSQKYRASWTA